MNKEYTVVPKQITVYYVKYPDGTLSQSCYNETRANEFARRLNAGEVNPVIGFEYIDTRSSEARN